MAYTAGNYIIRSALDEDTVLLTSGGSKSKNASIAAGAFQETDNRCYWKFAAATNSSYNKIYNINAGTNTGYITAATVAAGKTITQTAYAAAKGSWLATASGHTMDVRGVSVNTYFLTPIGNASLYLTVPDGGGTLYLAEALTDTTAQEFYFEPSTYFDKKLGTPTGLTNLNGNDYVIETSTAATTVTPRWKCSKTSTIYEQHYRTRMYDELGNVGEWSAWSSWSKIVAAKVSSGVMKSGTDVSVPAVDNIEFMQCDVQIEERLTSAKNSSSYNTTGTVTHGPAVSGLIRKWIVPTISVTSATCKQYGLAIGYTSNYTVGGNTIAAVSIKDGTVVLVENYILTEQDYQGEFEITWDKLKQIPGEGHTLEIIFKLDESNGVVSKTVTSNVTVTYDSSIGLPFTPVYTLTNRMTIDAKISAYDSIECYIQRQDLEGKDVWTAVDEAVSDNASYRHFEIIPPFGIAPTIMWVVTTTENNQMQWGYSRATLADTYKINTKYYAWNWVDDDKVPHAYIMKYRANSIVQPMDTISLPGTKFVTTNRDYGVFRFTKSVDRQLDMEGAIINGETDDYCTKAAAEKLIKANHTVFRQPNSKWYQTALKTITFNREELYETVQIQQEAESR